MKDWVREYPCMYESKLNAAVMTITYTIPAYEILNVDLDCPKEFRETQVYSYASQMIIQQAMQDFTVFVEKEKTKNPTFGGKVDPYFEDDNDD